jgi:hypothetical protein
MTSMDGRERALGRYVPGDGVAAAPAYPRRSAFGHVHRGLQAAGARPEHLT